ncbi:MAG: AAA family ATPase [Dehalococcoidales bacterium]|nr:AAA family ATPase [Dehalococcoidales bacterium]
MNLQSDNKSSQIKSGYDLVNTPVPDIPYRILGLLRSNGGRLSITAQYKSEKSLLAHDLALRVAAGEDWLGFKTSQGKVLYVNLEISEEKFQERTQDFHAEGNYSQLALSSFMAITILDKNLCLDISEIVIQEVLNTSLGNGFKIDLLILDPRARIVAGSENEETVIKHLCDNIDKLLANNHGLSVVIVTHMGKDPTRGAIGHSRFSGWLDTEITVVKSDKMISKKELHIVGRDIERVIIPLDFNYPLHRVSPIERMARESKVEAAKKFIIGHLQNGPLDEQRIRTEAKGNNITDYAFHSAIRELKDENRIQAVPAGGQGNRKLLKLADKVVD